MAGSEHSLDLELIEKLEAICVPLGLSGGLVRHATPEQLQILATAILRKPSTHTATHEEIRARDYEIESLKKRIRGMGYKISCLTSELDGFRNSKPVIQQPTPEKRG